MIEVIYSGETREPKTQENGVLSALKNIRQIGSGGKTTRIYVEDCVMGFLKRQMEKEDPVVVTLLGNETKEEGVTYLFIKGALVPDGIQVKGETLDFSSQAFLHLYEEAEAFFPKKEILGWYLPAYEMIAKYGASLGQNSRLFLVEDPTEGQEIFYLWEQKHLSKQGGYYIFYERNEEMKAYMQQTKEKKEEGMERRKIWTVVEGSGEPSVEKNTRNQVEHSQKKSEVHHGKKSSGIWKDAFKTTTDKTKKEDFVDDYEEMNPADAFSAPQPKLTTFLYGASTVMAIVVLVIGITLINNYDKMYEMQEAIDTIAMTVSEGRAEEKEKEEGDIAKQEVKESQESLPQEQQQETETGSKNTTLKGQALLESDDRDTPAQQQNQESLGNNQQNQESVAGNEQETTASTTPLYYEIQKGDTLASISRKFYQSTDKIEEIKRLNDGINENDLVVGQKIILP